MLYFTRWKALGDHSDGARGLPVRGSEFLPRSHRARPGRNGRSAISCSASTCRAARTCCSKSMPNSVKKDKLDQVRDDVRRSLRDAKIGYTGGSACAATMSKSVSPRTADVPTAITKLRELSQPLGGLLGHERPAQPGSPGRRRRPDPPYGAAGRDQSIASASRSNSRSRSSSAASTSSAPSSR